MNTNTSQIEENTSTIDKFKKQAERLPCFFRNRDYICTTTDFISSEAVVNAFGFSNPSASHQYEFNAELIMIYESNMCYPLNEQSFDYDIGFLNEVYDSFIQEINRSYGSEWDKAFIEMREGRGFRFYMRNDYDDDLKGTFEMNLWLVQEIRAGKMTAEYAINYHNFNCHYLFN